MKPKKSSGRRLLRSSALMLAILFGGSVLLGFAMAGDEDEALVRPAPETFGTRRPAIDDVVAYRTERFHEGEWIHDPGVDGSVSYGLVGQDEILDGAGVPSRVNQVTIDYGHDTGWEWALVDAHDHRLVGMNRFEDQERRHDRTVIPNGPTDPTTTTTDMETLNITDFWEGHQERVPLFCGLFHSLQGTLKNMDGNVSLFQNCILPPGDGRPAVQMTPEHRFIADRLERLGDHDTVVFRMNGFPHPEIPDRAHINVSVWISDQIPYPLRIENTYTIGDKTDHYALRLTGLARGDRPFGMEPPTLRPAPELEFAPTRPWGIDDGGIDHPFPLSVAYGNALKDPLYDDLRDFLETHPDAFTYRADYVERLWDQEIQRTWSVTATDGQAVIHFCSRQYVRPVAGMLVPGSIPIDLPEEPATYEVETCDAGQVDPVGPDAVPDRMPTAASLLARTRAYFDSQGYKGEPNAYSFRLCEPEDCRSVYRPGLARWNVSYFPSQEPPLLGNEIRWTSAGLAIDLHGSTSGYMFHSRTSEQGVDRDASQPPEDKTLDPPRPQSVETGSGSHGMTLDAKTTAGLGILAIAVGALYYGWSALKGGLLGMFTRVRRPDALEHPKRRQIERILRSHPGLHLQDIADRAGIPRSVAKHHLAKLEVVGLVCSIVGKHYTCYFLKGTMDRRLMQAAPILKAPGALAVLEAVKGEPGRHLRELARVTGLQPSNVHRYVVRLSEVGLVETRRKGRCVHHYPTQVASKIA